MPSKDFLIFFDVVPLDCAISVITASPGCLSALTPESWPATVVRAIAVAELLRAVVVLL